MSRTHVEQAQPPSGIATGSPVVVAGMHRTGTSMIAKVLRLGGLWLGKDEDMIDPAADNPEGFFEHAGVVQMNEELLEATGGAWDNPPGLGPLGADDPRVAPLGGQARCVIAELSGRCHWGWKDPRTSLTATFWLDLLPELRFVICVRHPLEVAMSLKRRNQVSYSLGLSLWERYYTTILDTVDPARRLVTHYAAHVDGKPGELERLLSFAGLPAESSSTARSGLDEQLRHHRIAASLAEAGVSPATIELYRTLCEEAHWAVEAESRRAPSATVNRAVLDLAASKELVDTQRRHIERLESQMRASLSWRIESLEQQVRALDKGLAALDLEPTRIALSGVEDRLETVDETVRDAINRWEARSPGDVAMVDACRTAVRVHVPREAPVLVVGKGDPAFAHLAGRAVSNFPQDSDGRYPGFALGEGQAAIAHLEALRARGHRFLLVPSSSRWWLDSYPSFGEHVVNRYHVVGSNPSLGLLADMTSRRSPAGGWPLAVSDSIDRLARMTGRSLAVLDWTEIGMAAHLPRHNVFSPLGCDGRLSYLDTSVDVVLIEDDGRRTEARRVGSVAIVSLRRTGGGHPEVDSVDMLAEGDGALEPPMAVVLAVDRPDRQWLTRLEETLQEEPSCNLVTGIEEGAGEAEFVAIVDEGVLPLPGCFLTARKALERDGRVGAIAVKLFTDQGSLEAAGVTLFADGSYAGIAAGSFDVGAPWHEYVRETCWGPGLMLFRAAALRNISRKAPQSAVHPVLSARLWSAGSRVVYQPGAAAVRAGTATATDVDAVRAAWTGSQLRHPTRPAALDELAWRELLVGEDLTGELA